MRLIDAISSGRLKHPYYSNAFMGVLLLLVAPLVCILSIEINVLLFLAV